MSRFLPLLGLGAALTGCQALVPNTPPDLVSFNGVEIHPRRIDFGLTAADLPQVRLGERLDIELEVDDRQGHDVRVWFIAPPPGLVFDPDGTTGHWDVPEALPEPEPEYWALDIVLQDTAADPRSATYPIPLDWGDLRP